MKPTEPEIDFCDSAVYELRQPLTSITGQVQLARRLLETDPPRAREALDHVVTQIARVNLMLGELRDRARDAAEMDALLKS
jgi:signal transduction histidine kinase